MRDIGKTISPEELKSWFNEKWSKGVAKAGFTNKDYELQLDYLNVLPGKKLLDIGCGGGYLLREAGKRGLITFGIDISDVSIELCRNNAPPHSDIRIGAAEKLPWDSSYFDYITCYRSLQFFLNPEKGTQEISRVLKEDGLANICLPNTYWLRWIWNAFRNGIPPSHGRELERFGTKLEWSNLLETNGLNVIKIYKDNPSPSIIPLTARTSIRLVYYLFKPLIPTNLSWNFNYICKKKM